MSAPSKMALSSAAQNFFKTRGVSQQVGFTGKSTSKVVPAVTTAASSIASQLPTIVEQAPVLPAVVTHVSKVMEQIATKATSAPPTVSPSLFERVLSILPTLEKQMPDPVRLLAMIQATRIALSIISAVILKKRKQNLADLQKANTQTALIVSQFKDLVPRLRTLTSLTSSMQQTAGIFKALSTTPDTPFDLPTLIKEADTAIDLFKVELEKILQDQNDNLPLAYQLIHDLQDAKKAVQNANNHLQASKQTLQALLSPSTTTPTPPPLTQATAERSRIVSALEQVEKRYTSFLSQIKENNQSCAELLQNIEKNIPSQATLRDLQILSELVQFILDLKKANSLQGLLPTTQQLKLAAATLEAEAKKLDEEIASLKALSDQA